MKSKSSLLKSTSTPIDLWLILATFTLIVFGLIAIYDSSVVTAFRDFGDKFYFFKNQLTWATLGFFAFLFFSFFDYRKLVKLGPIFVAVGTFLLIAVLVPFIGTEALGARRWISLGNLTFQPSEFVKLAVIFYATNIMSKIKDHRIIFFDSIIVYFLPILVVTALVIIQPDLGTALIFTALAIIIYFAACAPIWHFLLAIPVLIAGTLAAIVTQPYRLERLRAFFDPSYDPSGASYQINQIIIAIASGGLFGVGLGGAHSKFEFIPEVHNDAIFAVIIEEIGFIGGVILIGVFLFLISRAIKISIETADYSGKILAIGIASLLAVQSLFNIASNVALVPLTGVPLPFISYGGSSLFVTLASIGILINIKRRS